MNADELLGWIGFLLLLAGAYVALSLERLL